MDSILYFDIPRNSEDTLMMIKNIEGFIDNEQ